MLTSEIKSKINWLWDRFWAGGLANPITAIEQISYLLFMKRLETVDHGKFFQKDEQQYKWSVFTKKTDNNELLDFVKNKVFPFIQTLGDANEPFAKAMSNASFVIEKPSLLKDAIETINEIYVAIEKQELDGQHFQDTLGDLYEHLLKATNEAGKNGQFRTPRHLIQLMCGLLQLDLEGKICDLTCGSAGFLVGSYQYIVSKYSAERQKDENGFEKGIDGSHLTDAQWQQLKNNTFFGFDIDQTMIRIGVMNLIMHGITKPQIYLMDSLSTKYDEYESDEQYHYILANPPFTGRIDSLELSKRLDKIYPPHKNGERVAQNVQSELLFMERIIRMLKPEGKAAVIIPEGVLFGSNKAYKATREIILKDCALEAVISLPSGVFLPYAGVKTSILVFTKKELNSKVYHTKKVWFYGMDSDGYSLDANRRKLKINPLPAISEAFLNQTAVPETDRKATCFSVSIEEIIKNKFELSFKQYRSLVYETQEYEPAKQVLARIMEMEKEIFNELNALNQLI